MKNNILCVLRAWIAIAALWAVAYAKEENPSVGVLTKVWGYWDFNGHPYTGYDENMRINGDLYWADTNLHVPWIGMWPPHWDPDTSPVDSLLSAPTLGLDPGRSYQFMMNVVSTTDGRVHVDTPPGYQSYIGGQARNVDHYSGPWFYYVQVNPIGEGVNPIAAEFTTSASITLAVNWQVSLGSLRNGQSAGAIQMVSHGTNSDWSPLYTPAMINYETDSDEVAVYRVNDVLRQIVANEVAIDIVTLNSTAYEIRCYNPQQLASTPSAFPRSFTGDPYLVYRIEQGASANSLKLTKEVRDITSLTSAFSVSRREIMRIERTGANPNYTWSRTAWTLDGQSAAATTTAQSTNGSGGTRVENISVFNPITSATAFSMKRTYAILSSGQESVTEETIGSTPSTSRTTVLSYDGNNSSPTSGYLTSISLPGGGWVAFDYHSPTTTGMHHLLSHRYQPFQD